VLPLGVNESVQPGDRRPHDIQLRFDLEPSARQVHADRVSVCVLLAFGVEPVDSLLQLLPFGFERQRVSMQIRQRVVPAAINGER